MTPDAILEAMAQVPFPTPEKPLLAKPTKTNLRRIGQFSLTDAIVLHRTLSSEAKLVLGFSINYPKLDPSLLTLKKVAGLDKARVVAAQKELEEAGIVEYDRPEHFYDRRNADDPRFDRSNRIAAIHPLADPFRPENQGATASVPPKIIRQLPRARKNASIFPLFLLFLIREQLRRGAIHLPRNVVGAHFGLQRQQVARLFKTISALLRDEGDGVLSIPGATHVIAPESIDREKTRTIRPIAVRADLSLPVYASDAEENKIAVLLDQMPERLREWALVAACLDSRNYACGVEDGISAETIIDALTRFADDPPFAIKTPGLYVALYADRDYLLDAIRHGKGRWTAVREEPHEQGDSEDDGRLAYLRRSFHVRVVLVPLTPNLLLRASLVK